MASSWPVIALGFAGLAITACDRPGAMPDVTRLSQIAPEWAAPGTCWAQEITPAVVESVTEQIITRPAELGPEGQVISPAIYRTKTRQQIVREREVTWIETLCPDKLTPELLASLQRALAARDFYAGPVSGALDAPTRAALYQYQRSQGFDSRNLALATARQFGLAAVDRATLDD